MSTIRARGAERGAALVLMGFGLIIVFGLVAALLLLGELGIRTAESQNAAEAVAMTCTRIAQLRGLDAVDGHPAVLAMAQANSRHPLQGVNCGVPIRDPDDPNGPSISFEPELGFNMPIPVRALRRDPNNEQEGFARQARAKGRSTEIVLSDVDWHFPKLVLTLDYSGSMGGGKVQQLREAVNILLDLGLDIDYGLVLFSSDVIQTLPIDRDDRQDDIRNAIGRDPGGSTNYAAPLLQGTDMLTGTGDDTGYYILFVGDGLPNQPGGDPTGLAYQAAERAWDRNVTTFTLFIGNPQNRQVLVNISGGPQNRRDPNHLFIAGNADQLRESFRRIVAQVLCTIGPVAPAPEEDQDIYVFVDLGNGEVPLEEINDVGGDPDGYGFSFVPGENKIRLTEAVCQAMVDTPDSELIVRFGRTELIDPEI